MVVDGGGGGEGLVNERERDDGGRHNLTWLVGLIYVFNFSNQAFTNN